MSPGISTVVGLLSFRRIVDIPFETCVAGLENLQGDGQDDDLRAGQSLLRGPIEHDRDTGTCRLEVRLARGPLRPQLRMRLELDRWSSRPARTRLELIPYRRVWPTKTYFRAGHLLLDSVIHWLSQFRPEQRFTAFPSRQPDGVADRSCNDTWLDPRVRVRAARRAAWSRATRLPSVSLGHRSIA